MTFNVVTLSGVTLSGVEGRRAKGGVTTFKKFIRKPALMAGFFLRYLNP